MGEINFTHQILTLLFSVVGGMFLAVVYAVFSVIRKCFKNNAVITFFCDVLFFVFSAFFCFCIMLLRSLGNVRVFILFGVMIGFLIILKTVYKPLVTLLYNILSSAYKIILNIIKIIKKYLKQCSVMLYNFYISVLRKRKEKSGNKKKT